MSGVHNESQRETSLSTSRKRGVKHAVNRDNSPALHRSSEVGFLCFLGERHNLTYT